MQVGKKVYYQGKNWTVACFFPDTMGLIPMKPYDTWIECFNEVGFTYEIKTQLLYKHPTYSQYLSVYSKDIFPSEIKKHYDYLSLKLLEGQINNAPGLWSALQITQSYSPSDTTRSSEIVYDEESEWKKIYKEITKEPLWKDEDLVPNPL